MTSDAYFNTASTNFDKSVVPLVLKAVQRTLRGGLQFTPKGSVIPAIHVPRTDGTFRAFAYGDIDNSTAVAALGDADPDPALVDLDADYIEFTATRKGAGVGLTDNATKKSPHNMLGIASEKIGRSVAVHMDDVARALYAAATPSIFGGSGNAAVGEVAAGDNLIASNVKDAVAILRARDVEPLPGGFYAMVTDPYVIRDMQDDDDLGGWIDAKKYAAPGDLLTGEAGMYAGVRVINAGSRGIVSAGAGTGLIDVHIPVVIGMDALFLALGDVEVNTNIGADKSDRWNRRDSVTWKAFTGGVKNDLQSIERFVTLAVATTLS